MITLLLSALVLAAPGGKISYRKKVMLDPGYRPTMTRKQIDTALRPPARKRVVYEQRRVQPAPRPRPRVNFGFSVGFPYGSVSYSPGWGWGLGVHLPWPGYHRGGYSRPRYHR